MKLFRFLIIFFFHFLLFIQLQNQKRRQIIIIGFLYALTHKRSVAEAEVVFNSICTIKLSSKEEEESIQKVEVSVGTHRHTHTYIRAFLIQLMLMMIQFKRRRRSKANRISVFLNEKPLRNEARARFNDRQAYMPVFYMSLLKS